MSSALSSFKRDESGLESIEYGVMTALIVTGIVVALGTLTTAVFVGFGRITEVIEVIP